jgi:hypothetical protein
LCFACSVYSCVSVSVIAKQVKTITVAAPYQANAFAKLDDLTKQIGIYKSIQVLLSLARGSLRKPLASISFFGLSHLDCLSPCPDIPCFRRRMPGSAAMSIAPCTRTSPFWGRGRLASFDVAPRNTQHLISSMVYSPAGAATMMCSMYLNVISSNQMERGQL